MTPYAGASFADVPMNRGGDLESRRGSVTSEVNVSDDEDVRLEIATAESIETSMANVADNDIADGGDGDATMLAPEPSSEEVRVSFGESTLRHFHGNCPPDKCFVRGEVKLATKVGDGRRGSQLRSSSNGVKKKQNRGKRASRDARKKKNRKRK